MINDVSLVSVIIPVYNCERYLAEAIESVLAQTYHPLEVIIIDDGSTDGSAAIAKNFGTRVQYVHKQQGGTAAARNVGIGLAKGGYLAFLDSDDIWMEEKLNLQMAVFADDPDIDIVFGNVVQFNSTESDNTLKSASGQNDEILPGYIPSAMVIKHDSFSRVGPFDENWGLGEWIDWYTKAIDHGLKIHMLTQVVMKRRIHESNIGIRERDQRFEYVRVLKKTLDRRRKQRTSQ